jgi:uncharacterized membrane protein
MLLSSASTLRNVYIVKSFQLALSLFIRSEGVAPYPQCNKVLQVQTAKSLDYLSKPLVIFGRARN